MDGDWIMNTLKRTFGEVAIGDHISWPGYNPDTANRYEVTQIYDSNPPDAGHRFYDLVNIDSGSRFDRSMYSNDVPILIIQPIPEPLPEETVQAAIIQLQKLAS